MWLWTSLSLLLSAAQASVSPPQSPPFQLKPVQLLSSAQSRPQCVYLLWPCSPTNVPSPFPVPSVPLPLSPYLPPSSLLPPPPPPPLSIPLPFSVCLTSVSFPRAHWCLRIRCSRTSSWCSSSPPTRPSLTWPLTHSPTSAYQQPSLSHVAGYLLSIAGTTQSVSVW